MSDHEIGTFVLENVPRRCRLESAIIEFAARQRGLDVERVKQSTIFVRFPNGDVPFIGLHGPDSSSVGRWILGEKHAYRALAMRSGISADRFQDDVTGDHMWLFVLDGRVVAATHLVSANVVGDGHRDVAELIATKNATRTSHPYLRDHPIPDDLATLDALTTAGRDLAFVPADGEQVMVQSTPGEGIDIVDVTDTVDPSMGELAVSVVGVIPGLPYACVEIVSPGANEYVINDLHYAFPPVAHFPTDGEPCDIAGAIVDHYLNVPRWEATRKASVRQPAASVE